MGAHPLFFDERPDGWRPRDRLDLPVAHDDPLAIRTAGTSSAVS